mmetsp:Transcript_26622/g.67637  ORF Transcript_26622/g.67637 Transcript_26622/m.67637 type:complete len:211 (-) Transcript_26622:81-713(-)
MKVTCFRLASSSTARHSLTRSSTRTYAKAISCTTCSTRWLMLETARTLRSAQSRVAVSESATTAMSSRSRGCGAVTLSVNCLPCRITSATVLKTLLAEGWSKLSMSSPRSISETGLPQAQICFWRTCCWMRGIWWQRWSTLPGLQGPPLRAGFFTCSVRLLTSGSTIMARKQVQPCRAQWKAQLPRLAWLVFTSATHVARGAQSAGITVT